MFSGCGLNKKEKTIDDKIFAEVQYLDKKVSECLIGITGDLEQKEKLIQKTEKVQSGESSGGNSSQASSSSENGEAEGKEDSESEGSSESKENSENKNSSGSKGNAESKNSSEGKENSENKNSSESKGNTESKNSPEGKENSENKNSSESKEDTENKENTEGKNSSKGSSESKVDDKQEGSSNSQSGDSKKTTSMSLQYTDLDEEKELDWQEIEKNIQEIYLSWTTVETDILSKNILKQDELNPIRSCINNFIISSSDKSKDDFLKNSADFYEKLTIVLEKINYDQNSVKRLKIKQFMYEAYYGVIIDDWNITESSLKNANSEISAMEHVDEQTKIMFRNLLDGLQDKNKSVFYLKGSDAIKKLEYI